MHEEEGEREVVRVVGWYPWRPERSLVQGVRCVERFCWQVLEELGAVPQEVGKFLQKRRASKGHL